MCKKPVVACVILLEKFAYKNDKKVKSFGSENIKLVYISIVLVKRDLPYQYSPRME